ncbi:MAG: hypothetical protein LC737_09245, partial [Chloroflexi bacterium]|nr:hypothetical protein [Chloroflexota bacterium]
LYGACALALVFAVRTWLVARSQRHRTIYSIEKEVAGERSIRALLIAVSSILLAVSVYWAGTNVSSSTPVAPQRSPTPNIALLFNAPTATPTTLVVTPSAPEPSPTPLRSGTLPPQPTEVKQPTPKQQQQPTVSPTPRPTAMPTTAPPSPMPLPAACPDLGARIISPGTDARLSGTVSILGSANIANFQYYKIEFGIGDQPGSWTVIGQLHRQPVNNGVLEVVNTTSFAPGVYRLRLTVVDQSGNFPISPCSVRVMIGG